MEKRKKQWLHSCFFSGWLLWRVIFGRKKLLDAKGPFGDNVLKNPARCMYNVCVCLYVWVYVFIMYVRKPRRVFRLLTSNFILKTSYFKLHT